MKNVTVIIRRTPFNTVRNSEALRMSVGLTLRENAVRVVFVDDGVYLLAPCNPKAIESPEINKHIEILPQLGHELFAEKEAWEDRGLDTLAYKVTIRPRAEIVNIISQSDVVIAY